MTITIRRGVVADADRASDLWLRARRGAEGLIPRAAHGDDDAKRWFREHVVHELELWLAVTDPDELVGILVLDGGWVDQLYVDPAQTGRGIGAQLLELAKRERPAGLQLWTFASNHPAQRFYERHDFIEAERTDGSLNEARAPDIRYLWPMRPPGTDCSPSSHRIGSP